MKLFLLLIGNGARAIANGQRDPGRYRGIV
jgi:hypothetical protein